MTPNELHAILDRLGLSPTEAGRLAATADEGRTIRRWLDGTRDISGPGEQLFRLLDALPPRIRASAIAMLRG